MTADTSEIALWEAVLSHPSGRNRAWNAPGTYERARAVLREAGVLPVHEVQADLPSATMTTERPARCENCGERMEAQDCAGGGPCR